MKCLRQREQPGVPERRPTVSKGDLPVGRRIGRHPDGSFEVEGDVVRLVEVTDNRLAFAVALVRAGAALPVVATTFINLAELFRAKGYYTEAEPLYQRALIIYENTLGPEHPHVATGLNNIAFHFEG